MYRSCLLSTLSASLLFLTGTSTSHAIGIDTYFGYNYVESSATGFEVNLTSITYIGEGGGIFTTTMPAFPGDVSTSPGITRTGIPDIDGLTGLPTFTNGGDGESTRTIGETVSINWDTSGAFPTIQILSITADALDFTGSWSADLSTPYTVGLIPFGENNELNSSLVDSQDDIYDAVIGTAFATSAPPAFSPLPEPTFFGDFTFSAASAVPIPATVWLFGSGLLGLIEISRRKKAA
ncbi:MAG: hypothetical protein EP297_03230 [Gammaproteobacteria bacterium]|nr:MAG: hypothetical protein EP297_03230 [Gammaproteobacteria bacterium]